MRDLMNLFVQQSLVGFIAAVLLASMVWFGGDYLGETVRDARGLICVLVMVLWFVLFLVQRLQASKRAQTMEARLEEQGEADQEHAMPTRRGEVEELQKGFDDALRTLRNSKLGKRALTTLPWYVIIGPPASGKTTLLRESGLDFPSLNQSRRGIRGLGGTRNCDWWFNEHGILLDTAGRYMTEADDRDEWLQFLSILKQGRKRNAINGAIIAFSIEDLIGANERDLDDHAENIRERVDELTRQLDVVFPVYLLFTKCDRWPGFVEFFGDYSRAERAQVWGCTLPEQAASSDVGETVRAEFGRLYERLSEVRVPILVDEPRQPNRDRIYQFPLQFAELRNSVSYFIDRIFQPNPYQESPMIRGFYFTSGTQEGAPMDQLLAQVRGALGIQTSYEPAYDDEYGEYGEDGEAGLQKKTYFVDDLFRKVIFPDQDLARPSGRVEQRRRVAAVALTAASVILSLVLGIVLSGRFGVTEELLGSTKQAVSDAKEHRDPATADSHQALTTLSNQLSRLGEASSAGSWPFALETRNLHAQVGRHYSLALKRVHVDRAMRQLLIEVGRIKKLGPPADRSAAELRLIAAENVLEVYRALRSGRADPEVQKLILDKYWTEPQVAASPGVDPKRHAAWFFAHAVTDSALRADHDDSVEIVLREEIAICKKRMDEDLLTAPPVDLDERTLQAEGHDFSRPIRLAEKLAEEANRRSRVASSRAVEAGFRRDQRDSLQAVLVEVVKKTKSSHKVHEDFVAAWEKAEKDASRKLVRRARDAWTNYIDEIDFRGPDSLPASIESFNELVYEFNVLVPKLRYELDGEDGKGTWLSKVRDELTGFTTQDAVVQLALEGFDRRLAANLQGFIGEHGVLPKVASHVSAFRRGVKKCGVGLTDPVEMVLFQMVQRVCDSAADHVIERIRNALGGYAARDWREKVYEPFRAAGLLPGQDPLSKSDAATFARLIDPKGETSQQIARVRALWNTLLEGRNGFLPSVGLWPFLNRYEALQKIFFSTDTFGLRLSLRIRSSEIGDYGTLILKFGKQRVDSADVPQTEPVEVVWTGAPGAELVVRRDGRAVQGRLVERSFGTHGIGGRELSGPWALLRLLQMGRETSIRFPGDPIPGYTRLAFQFYSALSPEPEPGGNRSADDPKVTVVFHAKVDQDPALLEQPADAILQVNVPESPANPVSR